MADSPTSKEQDDDGDTPRCAGTEIETTPKAEAEGISSRDSNKAAAAVADVGDTVGHVIFAFGMIIISKMGPFGAPRVLFS